MPGPSSLGVPWSKTPPGASRSSPFSRNGRRRLQTKCHPGHPERFQIFEATHPRPTHLRAYASPAASPRPAQGSLPARAGSPLAGRVSHPLDDKRSFMESSHPPFPSDQPCLVAPLSLGQFTSRWLKCPKIRAITFGGPLHPMICSRAKAQQMPNPRGAVPAPAVATRGVLHRRVASS